MKHKELITIIAIGFITALISILISGAIFGSPKKNPIKVPVVNKISSEFPTPQTDENYKEFFNEQANNPTKIIQIGGSSNTAPFKGTSQQ